MRVCTRVCVCVCTRARVGVYVSVAIAKRPVLPLYVEEWALYKFPLLLFCLWFCLPSSRNLAAGTCA